MPSLEPSIQPYRITSDRYGQISLRCVEFHIRVEIRDRYNIDDSLFSSSGNVVFADFRAVQQFVHLFNQDRPDHLRISPATLNAAALMDEMLHLAIARYRETVEPDVIERALAELDEELGSLAVDHMLNSFLTLFPNTDIYRSKISPEAYLQGQTEGVPNRVLTLEELLVGRICNDNPAYQPLHDLISDDELRLDPGYQRVVVAFSRPSGGSPVASGQRMSLIDVLTEPSHRAPYSLSAQLAFVRDDWAVQMSPVVAERLTMGTGLIAEEHHALAFKGFQGGPGPVEIPMFKAEPEEENFSPDIDWMPRVIMVAKNALVWLDQLSKRYNRTITRLDEIPESEIEQLALWGFNALWLIGVWQRSEASRKLKQWSGNPEAASSAYSLFDYAIAEELGGEDALRKLSEICARHGIRLASDMVPNHTGIDSSWVREHPDWFIQLPHPPYPGYKYSSESLGTPDGPILQVEDGYFDRSDAAVTFRWQDRHTGEERYIYHGNDGTGMPWNDTAQLDFSRADVREAVIQAILHVARLFPIIRFDAAMVLTKKHFHRLWFPEPGSGEGVPSRATFGLRRRAFDAKMPTEFWREVVDRVAVDVPDTLLLAEAFWLLEGYFVRTLGMHRVYNSAFMHMLMKEDNADYRDVIRKTVAFEPEILKRYVNFMSNPDEETAIEQFGDGDKFFGVCVLMQTLPGLPMFAHGQVEGLREKYGMEYRRAYLDEESRPDLMARYERDIVPVARRRHLFAEAEHFRLFDFRGAHGRVNENVFAFSNRAGNEQAVVIYNNRFESAKGTILMESRDPDSTVQPVSIAQALDLKLGDDDVVTCRDLVSDLEYVVSAGQILSAGLPISLRGYEYRVLVDFAVVPDPTHSLSHLARRLAGRGVVDLEQARSALHIKPAVDVLAAVIHSGLSSQEHSSGQPVDLSSGDRIGLDQDSFGALLDDVHERACELAKLTDLGVEFPWKRSSRYRSALKLVSASMSEGTPEKAVLVGWMTTHALSTVDSEILPGVVEALLVALGLATDEGAIAIAEICRGLSDLGVETVAASRPIERFIPLSSSTEIADALGVHEFAGTAYFNKERFETFAAAAFCQGALAERRTGGPGTAKRVATHYDAYRRLISIMEKSDYQWMAVRSRIGRIRRMRKTSLKTTSNGKTNT